MTGGCCGTSLGHIKAISAAAKGNEIVKRVDNQY